MSYDRTLIESGWSFTQTSSTNIKVDKEEWHQCASFPTSVQAELTKSGKIPHFHKGLNEWEIQWIAEADWRFQNKFEVTQEQLERAIVDLVLEGLDTYCEVSLNGHHIAYTDNMFLHHRFEVKGKLRVGQNDLVLQFKAPMTEARRLQEANGGPRKSWNGDPARMYSRKAQYGWGWDWGPIVMTVGPWRHIALESYNYRLKDVRIDTTLSGAKYDEASISLQYEVHPIPPKSDDFLLEWSIRQRSAKSDEIYSASSAVSPSALEHQFKQKEVQPWWPVGYGKQPLYEVDIRLVSKGKEHARVTKTVGFRDVKVIQEPLEGQPGTSFVFQVNGVRIFAGGSNWIPGDNLLTEMPAERYRKWVELLIEGNQNMLRVWGGGIYEHQALYDTCDELGVLVWQDFMFGCGLYPSYKEINASIKVEAEQNVELLRDHPSVVIFAGNNEDYTVAESEKVMDYNDNSGDYMKTKFPARQIYEVILPEVVERLSSIHYHRSSPYGGESSNDPTVGDIHQWNVWHGTQEPWANWDKLAGRFVSEFGMQGYPNMRTVEEWDDDKAQLFPQSRVSVNHNKADGFERRLELYLMENFRHAMDMPSYVYYTQAMQAECLAAAYRLWRRNWKGRGKEYTSGALVWQINDCWPCVSWAIADYYLRPKPAFYSIARELRPYTVGMTRKDIKTFKVKDTFALFEIHQEIQLWGCNSSLEPKAVQIELEAFDLDKGSLGVETYDKTLEPNASTEIWKGDVPGQLVRTTDGQVPKPIVVQARLKDSATGEILARYSNWPEPWKYLIFPDPGLSIDVDGDKVTLNCKKPIKGLVLDVEGDEAKWSDQAIDLFPGDTQVVTAAGLKGRKVLARYIGDGSA